jgi:hypothetical protein
MATLKNRSLPPGDNQVQLRARCPFYFLKGEVRVCGLQQGLPVILVALLGVGRGQHSNVRVPVRVSGTHTSNE